MGGRKGVLVAMCVVYSLAAATTLGGIAIRAVEDNEREPVQDNNAALVAKFIQSETSSDASQSQRETKSANTHQQATVPRETQDVTASVQSSTTVAETKQSSTQGSNATQPANGTAATRSSTQNAESTQPSTKTAETTQASTQSSGAAQSETWGSDAYGLCISDKGSVRIRSGKTAESDTLGWVPKNATCELMEETFDTWVKIRYNGKVGYVDFNYFSIIAK